MRDFELVVPAYNEEKNLTFLIDRAIEAATKNGFSPQQFQFVIVNNGSKDQTGTLLNALSQTERGIWFRTIEVPVNQGYGFGVHQGLKATNAKYVGWSHADLQCHPADSFKALEVLKAQQRRTLVKGTRRGRNWKDQLVSHTFAFLSKLILRLEPGEINAQPKVFDRGLVEYIKNPPNNFAFDLYVLYVAQRLGYVIKTIGVEFPPRIHGVSNWASNFFSRYKTILGLIQYMFTLRISQGSAVKKL